MKHSRFVNQMARQLVHLTDSLYQQLHCWLSIPLCSCIGCLSYDHIVTYILSTTRARDSLNFTHSEAIRSSSSSSRRASCTAQISELFKRAWSIQLHSRDFKMRSALNDRSTSHDVTGHTKIRLIGTLCLYSPGIHFTPLVPLACLAVHGKYPAKIQSARDGDDGH